MKKDFCSDKEKMIDFNNLSKEEFLESYSYITEEEYNCTASLIKCPVCESVDECYNNTGVCQDIPR